MYLSNLEYIIIILSILYLIENKAIYNLIYFIIIILLLTYFIFNIGITENNKEHEYMSIIILIIYISALAILFGIVILVTKTQKNYVSLIWKTYFNYSPLFLLSLFFLLLFFILVPNSLSSFSSLSFFPSYPLSLSPLPSLLQIQNLDFICNLGKILIGNYNIIFIFIFLMILLFVSIIVVINILL